ncbi:MAG: sulfatase-like hydrolase/transferase, partial [Acidobacteriota bacterium]
LYPPAHGVNNRDRMGSPELQTILKLARDAGYAVPNLNFFTFAPYYKNLGLPEINREYFGEREESPLLNWLDRHLKDSTTENPFFVWFHTTIVHQPYRPAPESLPDTLENLEKRPGIKAVLNGAIVPKGSTQFQEGDQPILEALYDAEVRRVDRFFGEVLKRLEEAGQFDKTLIVLTADHGEELLDHGFVGHASTSLEAKLFDELVHIPLILSYPGKVPAGSTIAQPASQVDIFPTLLRLLNLEAKSPLEGTDLFDLPASRPIYFESVIAGNQTPHNREHEWVRGILKGRYKYTSNGQLYDHSTDPSELKDIAADNPETVESLQTALESWLSESKALGERLFGSSDRVMLNVRPQECPRIYTPGNKQTLEYDIHTGALLFDWSGDMKTTYEIEYDIGTGDHNVAGKYEIQGNHQILGPFPRELWINLKAWNPFRFRVSPQSTEPCWSEWVEFYF